MEDMSASSETILEGLDDAQMSAVTALDGPVRIIAGAGAGKTRTVTRRIAYACARGDWDARQGARRDVLGEGGRGDARAAADAGVATT